MTGLAFSNWPRSRAEVRIVMPTDAIRMAVHATIVTVSINALRSERTAETHKRRMKMDNKRKHCIAQPPEKNASPQKSGGVTQCPKVWRRDQSIETADDK